MSSFGARESWPADTIAPTHTNTLSNWTDPPPRVTVLLVDDDPVILRCHARCLDTEFDVESCPSALEADRRIAQGGIDVVVSDVSMPGMTGFELLRAVRERDARLPVILVSAQSTTDRAADAVTEGAFVYLTKPVTGAMLRAAVRLAAQYRRSPRTDRPPPRTAQRLSDAPRS
jgi:DNA-binding NtrC family response regulator